MKLPPIYDADDNMREKWKNEGISGSDGYGPGSELVLEAMKGSYCRVCGGMTAKDDWMQEKLYCSKQCRSERNKSYIFKRMEDVKAQIEDNAKEEPLIIRAWHIMLEQMCDVVGIDYPADRLYVTMPSKKNYAFNASIREFLLQANVGKFRDINGVPMMEGDVVAFNHEGVMKFFALGFDKQACTLVAREHMIEGGLAFVVNAEAASKSTVVGNAFTFVAGGVVPTENEEVPDAVPEPEAKVADEDPGIVDEPEAVDEPTA